LQLFWPGKMHGERMFPCVAWLSFFPDEKQEQYLDAFLLFSNREKLAWLFRERHITTLG